MPPPDNPRFDFPVPIVHKIQICYKHIYRLGKKLPKRDMLGIHALVETACLEMLALAIEAAFTPRAQKKPLLQKLRIKTEVPKQLIRTEHEIAVISETQYIALEEPLVEISKMVNGWIRSVP